MLNRLFPIFLILTFLITTGQGCGGPSTAEQQAAEKVTLKIWRVFDGENTFSTIMNNYRALHPNVSFDYRQLRPSEYKAELLRAFAEGTGPDVFSVHNTWVGEYENLISPLPKTLTIPFEEIKGTIKKEKIVTSRTEATITPAQVRRDFIDIIAEESVLSYQPDPKSTPEERIFALPMSVDSLALFYNKDLLNAAGIAEPPKTWEEFQQAVVKLTTVGPNDSIIQSGGAIGTGENVERSFDILSLLMMQNGTPMTDARGRATFAAENRETKTMPGALATYFYTDFANPAKEVYTWNDDQPNSFDAFTAGKTAFFFGYSYHIPLIRARASKLNFAMSQMPQIGGGKTVNYANYWLETVSKASEHQNWAWDFIQFATSADQVTNYLETANKPTARRALINSQIDNEDLTVFVSQLLTSTAWYKGKDVEVAEQAFIDLINATLEGRELEKEIGITQNKVNQTL